LLIIDTKNQDIILPVFGKLKEIYGGLLPRQKEDVKRKLSILKLTDKSIEVKEKAAEVLEKLIADS